VFSTKDGAAMTVSHGIGLVKARRSGKGRELSSTQRLLTRNWWERLAAPESRNGAAVGIGNRISASSISGRSSGSRRPEAGRSRKGREVSRAQQAQTGNWWKRLTGD
jgi:hypothetical protein